MSEVKVVDLMDFCTEAQADEGIDIHIFDPNGNDMGLVVNMKGTDSQAYLDEDRKIKNRNLEYAKRKQDFTVGMEPERVEANATALMKACFNHLKQKVGEDLDGNPVYRQSWLIGGETLPSNVKTFGDIISRRGFFYIRRQVQTGMDKTASFLPKAPGSSLPPQKAVSNTISPTSME